MLRSKGYDGALSIEHEDSYMSVQEGFTKAVAYLRGVLIHEPSIPLVIVCSPNPLSWALAQPRPWSAMSAASGAASTRLGSPAPCALPNV